MGSGKVRQEPEKLPVPRRIPVQSAESVEDEKVSPDVVEEAASSVPSTIRVAGFAASKEKPYLQESIQGFNFNKGFSLAFWMKPVKSIDRLQIVFSNLRDPGENRGFALVIPAGSDALEISRFYEQCRAYTGTTSAEYASTIEKAAVPGKWTHIAMVVAPEDNLLSAYINGRRIQLLDNPQASGIEWDGKGGYMVIGAEYADGTRDRFRGEIKELVLCNTLLSREAIAELSTKEDR